MARDAQRLDVLPLVRTAVRERNNVIQVPIGVEHDLARRALIRLFECDLVPFARRESSPCDHVLFFFFRIPRLFLVREGGKWARKKPKSWENETWKRKGQAAPNPMSAAATKLSVRRSWFLTPEARSAFPAIRSDQGAMVFDEATGNTVRVRVAGRAATIERMDSRREDAVPIDTMSVKPNFLTRARRVSIKPDLSISGASAGRADDGVHFDPTRIQANAHIPSDYGFSDAIDEGRDGPDPDPGPDKSAGDEDKAAGDEDKSRCTDDKSRCTEDEARCAEDDARCYEDDVHVAEVADGLCDEGKANVAEARCDEDEADVAEDRCDDGKAHVAEDRCDEERERANPAEYAAVCALHARLLCLGSVVPGLLARVASAAFSVMREEDASRIGPVYLHYLQSALASSASARTLYSTQCEFAPIPFPRPSVEKPCIF
jgi:hypothetical protein